MSNFVFVIDTNKKPCNPIHPADARKLLKTGNAAIFRKYPFTLILKSVSVEPTRPIQIKLDPGSKTTGIALTQGEVCHLSVSPWRASRQSVIFGAELTHRGQTIKKSLESRSASRGSRRSRHTRYRKPRFLNRTRRAGWLVPSLGHRVKTTITWVNKLIKFAPITGISQELVRFDLQQHENPEISGIEYQQGELAGYEVREYLLNKWDRKCAYCDVENVPLQIEHIQPKAKGGSNRISNLCLACDSCNKKKGTQYIKEFLSKKPEVLKKVLAQAKRPLKDAAAVNSTRWALFNALKKTGLPIVTGSGGRTKFNRIALELPKAHWIDAACVGEIESLKVLVTKPLLIKATGHGTRQMCGTDKYGFPTRHRTNKQIHFGFQTGDIVVAVVKTGKYIGNYVGRIATRAKGNFSLSHQQGKFDVSYKYCKTIHKKDGYGYTC
ncbi:MAG: HNH endonuclease [Cyanomargarita calcarea GSE-NOS-MK-12-04C]|jgi:5-methylcytosine-specific restriction endonuclease McrA|uniref:HNH endonuclease n=1 Tax=Cyanomargarita calcarea GSE-NOS-MK-12-04C TaxID=2839659 RepID=A0A951QHP6_9CYAN|nr:HNH endonuclease [Cyanomargarita calcarea GSE-NOS-MK-12-04C]